MPTLLGSMELRLDADVTQDVWRAHEALTVLGSSVRSLSSTEGIARLLLRSESVASSHIEGLRMSTKRLLRAELYEEEPYNLRFDKSALAVLGNVHAMSDALTLAESSEQVSVNMFLQIHRSLCARTNIEQYGGCIRDIQNWVGGSSYNPLSADYVPPEPGRVSELLEDLAAFCNRTDIPAIVQAALAHAQFESIHPFVDGNGRTGRALIQLILRRRGLCPRFTPPISLIMATNLSEYLGCLNRLHTDDRGEECEALNDWVSFFASCVCEACEESLRLEAELDDMEAMWRESLGQVRKGSTLEELLGIMKGVPIFTANSMRTMCGRSQPAVTEALRRLIEAGVVRVTTKGKRNRVFEVPDVITVFNIFERRLASPAHDTLAQQPVRPVPDNLSHLK